MDNILFLNALTALIVIIDPIGTALIFNALTQGVGTKARVLTACKAIVISVSLLIVFGMYGQDLLEKLGISIEALRISGGLLLFYTAFHMVARRLDYSAPSGGGDISVFPMSVPLIAGPGTLTMAVLLFSGASHSSHEVSVVLAVLAVGIITFSALILAASVKRIIGKTGDEVLRRFLGVLLAALAIQFIMDGVNVFFNPI